MSDQGGRNKNPYEGKPPKAYWRSAVTAVSADEISGLCSPKLKLSSEHWIATAGSCFAQHIARHLKQKGFRYVDAEPPPELLPRALWGRYGFDLFSARYGNIYTTRHLRQLLERAFNRIAPSETAWENNGAYFDPFRPGIEPRGFGSEGELKRSVEIHLNAVRAMLRRMDVFVFTLGLTEAWCSVEDGMVYPTCPGTQAGTYSESKYKFVNFTYDEVLKDLQVAMRLCRRIRPKLHFILTVSPVPLTATATDEHVLVATTYSKSVLRAVAGHLASTLDYVDYFPSYEIITAPAFEGRFYESNKRSVSQAGVEFVMQTFFREFASGVTSERVEGSASEHEQIICDEQILEFYNQ